MEVNQLLGEIDKEKLLRGESIAGRDRQGEVTWR